MKHEKKSLNKALFSLSEVVMIEEDTRIAEILIKEFRDEYLFPPQRTWPKNEFELRTYSRWAANEILRRLKEKPNVGVINIIQGFIEELYCFENLTDSWTKIRIFRVARETATDILKLFL